MGSIISSGVGSGLDIVGLVSKLVEAEGAPQAARLTAQEAKVQGKLSALGTLRSALASFRDSLAALKSLDGFRGRKVQLSSAEFIAATASTSAVPGSYEIEVRSLATAHRLASQTFASASELVGTGTLTIALGGSSFTVEIDSESATLSDIAKAINEAPGNPGVSATVVTGAAGARLVLGSSQTGAAQRIVVTQSGGDGGLEQLVYDPSGSGVTNLTELRAAADASVLIDGFEATSATNSISDAISGLTIDLLAVNESGATTTLTVSYDKDAAYNGLLEAIKSITSYDATSKTSAPLFGDAGVRNIAFQLRRELGASVAGLDAALDTLSEIGITAGLDGTLNVDSAKLDAAFASNFDAVGELFSREDGGIAARLDAVLEPYLRSNGILDERNASLRATIEDIGDRRAALDVRLQALQERLLRQFNALDGLLAQLQSTSNFLSQQLGKLPGAAKLED
jgi:flagellar hook-associated protein 2